MPMPRKADCCSGVSFWNFLRFDLVRVGTAVEAEESEDVLAPMTPDTKPPTSGWMTCSVNPGAVAILIYL